MFIMTRIYTLPFSVITYLLSSVAIKLPRLGEDESSCLHHPTTITIAKLLMPTLLINGEGPGQIRIFVTALNVSSDPLPSPATPAAANTSQ